MTLADNDGKPMGQYVVKVFRPSAFDKSSKTNKEVCGNILATYFDLNTPKPALAIVDQQIINILNRNRKHKLVKGTYFASAYIESPLDYSESNGLILENWEIEHIFAFDVLIWNIDRHKGKPNLFFKGGEVFLIDHELSLASKYFNESFLNMLKEKEKYWNFTEIIDSNFVRKHIFLEHLREQNRNK